MFQIYSGIISYFLTFVNRFFVCILNIFYVLNTNNTIYLFLEIITKNIMIKNKSRNLDLFGWDGRIRTYECWSQSPEPYRLATPQYKTPLFSQPGNSGSVVRLMQQCCFLEVNMNTLSLFDRSPFGVAEWEGFEPSHGINRLTP